MLPIFNKIKQQRTQVYTSSIKQYLLNHTSSIRITHQFNPETHNLERHYEQQIGPTRTFELSCFQKSLPNTFQQSKGIFITQKLQFHRKISRKSAKPWAPIMTGDLLGEMNLNDPKMNHSTNYREMLPFPHPPQEINHENLTSKNIFFLTWSHEPNLKPHQSCGQFHQRKMGACKTAQKRNYANKRIEETKKAFFLHFSNQQRLWSMWYVIKCNK